MKRNAKIILLPDASQSQLLINTIDRYCELCNYISKILHRLYSDIHINKDTLNQVEKSREFHDKVRINFFPDISTSMIELAFFKVTRAYKYKDTPLYAYSFSGIYDCNSYLVSIKSVMPAPNNMGVIIISTLTGTQMMNFTFDEEKRHELEYVFDKSKLPDYELSYKKAEFYLNASVKEIKPKKPNMGRLSSWRA